MNKPKTEYVKIKIIGLKLNDKNKQYIEKLLGTESRILENKGDILTIHDFEIIQTWGSFKDLLPIVKELKPSKYKVNLERYQLYAKLLDGEAGIDYSKWAKEIQKRD